MQSSDSSLSEISLVFDSRKLTLGDSLTATASVISSKGTASQHGLFSYATFVEGARLITELSMMLKIIRLNILLLTYCKRYTASYGFRKECFLCQDWWGDLERSPIYRV